MSKEKDQTEPENSESAPKKKGRVENLKRGGKEPREITMPEYRYALWRAFGLYQASAARNAGIPPSTPTHRLEKRAAIKSLIQKKRTEYEADEELRLQEIRDEITAATTTSFLKVVGKIDRPHKYRGFDPAAKVLRLGAEIGGLVEGPRVTQNTQVNAQAAAASGNTFQPLYESPKLARVREAGGRVAFDAQVEAKAATLDGGDGLGS